MSDWKRQFTQKVESLHQGCVERFERFCEEVVEGLFDEFNEFTSQHDFVNTQPQAQRGFRSYKFSLTEDAYVLMFFRARGVDRVEFSYEFYVPGAGRTDVPANGRNVQEADRAWAERNFQQALDNFVSRFSEKTRAHEPAEAVLV